MVWSLNGAFDSFDKATGEIKRKSPFLINQAWALPAPDGGYITKLNPDQKAAFDKWVADNKVPYDPSDEADYDMPGFFLGLTSGDPAASTGVNANDGKLHFGDKWKTPYHKSFSNESMWATPAAPSWNEMDQLVLPDGTVTYDERADARWSSRLPKGDFGFFGS
jgi:hypothetical protein